MRLARLSPVVFFFQDYLGVVFVARCVTRGQSLIVKTLVRTNTQLPTAPLPCRLSANQALVLETVNTSISLKMPLYGEETPLLGEHPRSMQDWSRESHDIHQQFCALAGIPPSNQPKDVSPRIMKRSLYGRATHRRNAQNRTYLFTAALSNTLLLSQVVLGAALTALGASASSHILITLFGATNTIIAGIVAYLKSRGQPMRARMYRDDLDRVVDEIENSEIMWLGIQSGVHGYDEIAIDDSVSVRSEVARLTRLYDKVVRNNTLNDRKSCRKYL